MRSALHVYSRNGCCLCEEAMGTVERLAGLAGLDVVEVDIEADPEILERHRLRIPVVELEGEVLAWGRISERALRRALERKGYLR